MQALRNANPFVRTAIAVMFGFMSLVHSPLMAFAKSELHKQQTVSAHHRMHPVQSGHDDNHHQLPPSPDQATLCNGIGCFSVIFVSAISAPPAQLILLDTLAPGAPPPLHSVLPVPLDRPPRLQS
jgi:hypothetical protein